MIPVHRALAPLTLLALLACGGGEDAAPPTNPPTNPPPSNNPPAISYTPGVFPASSSFAAQCQTPRTGMDPDTGRPYADRSGSLLAEKHFLRSWSNELYLWYDEIPDRDPATIASVEGYFDVLKTNALLPSGAPKDQFHFTYETSEYRALAQSGTSVGYGIAWQFLQNSPPRRLAVQFVNAGTQAAAQGVTRGAELLTIDGLSIVNANTQADIDAINSALFAPANGTMHTLLFRGRNGATFTTTLQALAVSFDPVPVVRVLPTASGNLGYLLFNDHTASSEAALISGINLLRASAVQDLVLDLRYNGGGYLAIASELAYMIAGPTLTSGKNFERLTFNNKHTSVNPITGTALQPMPFFASTQFAATSTPLPSLNLSRVYVLTTPGTCSASESIINGLRGAGIQVFQIGGTTCGKPYGFYPHDNCGTTYFSIQIKGVNAVGFGDYVQGFSPSRNTGDPQANLPGCAARDDFAHDLGDTAEEMLRVAMTYRLTGACTGTAPALLAEPVSADPGPPMQTPARPWQENRILTP